MTYLGHLVTLTYLDLRSNLNLTFQGYIIYVSTRPSRDKHDAAKIVVLEIKDVIVENNIFFEFDLLTCGDLNFDLSKKCLY